MLISGLLVLAVGAFSIVCAAMNFDWFMEHHKAQFFVRFMGRDGARIFYGVLGTSALCAGAWMLVTG